MKILVTGATGFTGFALTEKLLKEGKKVRVLVRNRERLKIKDHKNLDVIVGDLLDEQKVDEAVNGIDIIYHIAAVFRDGSLNDNVYWDVHVNGTNNLLKYALKYDVKKFIHCSTGGVHGHIDEPPADENYRFSPGDIYQVTKLEGEKLALRYFENHGLHVTVIRPTPIYGPGDLRLLKLFKLALNNPTVVIGDGKIYYHLVYVDDLIDGIIKASKKDEVVGQPFIIGGKEILTLNELIDTIQKLHQTKYRRIHLPAKPFQVLGTVLEKLLVPMKIEPPIYRRRVDFFTKSRYFDINKAIQHLDYTPKVSVHEGLQKTSEWYQNNGYLKIK